MPITLDPPPITRGSRKGTGAFALAKARGESGPEVIPVDVGGRKDIADVSGDFTRRSIPAGLNQQDAARRVFRQARREGGAGRACPNYNNISFANVGFANVRIAHVAQVPSSAQPRRETVPQGSLNFRAWSGR